MAVNTDGISFLYQFSLGVYNTSNPGSNVISVTSTASGDHNKTNLTTTPLRQTWRSTSTATQTIVMQVNDEVVIPNVFAILNHNLSSNAVVRVKGAMTLDFSNPTFNVAFPYNRKHLCIFGSAGSAYKYYQFTIQDAGNVNGYIEIGRIVAGKTLTLTNNEDMADDFSLQNADLAYQMNTEGFFRASNQRVKVGTLSLNFPRLNSSSGNNANFLGLSDMYNFVGTTTPFLTIVDPSDVYFKLVWGQLNKMPQEQYTINRYVSLGFEIQEIY